MARWKRTLAVVCVAQLLTMVAFSSYFPSIPFFIQSMGEMSTAETTRWIAAFSSGAAIAMAIASPIWGTLSDRLGRKVMLLRATIAGSILAAIMGFVQTPLQLITVRTIQGIFCGTVSAAMTLVATQTPEEHMGTSLGIMQTIQYAGHALGPLIGGIVADTLGLRAMFPVASALMAIAAVMLVFGVHEKFTPAPREPRQRNERPWASLKMPNPSIVIMLLTMGALSAALGLLSPVLSLYMQSLAPDAPNISTLAGSAVSIAALTSSAAALVIGRLGDKYGQKRILLASAIGVALINIPQALVRTPGQLILLRGVQGILIGGITPTATAILAMSTPNERRGTIFGLNNSVRSGGRAVGPAVGAAVANGWGMASVFYAVAIMYALVSVTVAAFVQPVTPAEHAEESTKALSPR